MKILPEMFNHIVASVGTPPQFLKIVLGLGRQTSSGYESFTTFCRSMTTPVGSEPNAVPQGIDLLTRSWRHANVLQGFDISYNIRYFEPHGRQLQDPYSCRQSGIHHKFYFQGCRSIWTIIQPPQQFNEHLQQIDSQDQSHPLALHIRLIRSATYYFKEYLSFRASKLGLMVSLKTIASQALTWNWPECCVGRQSQHLQTLRRIRHWFFDEPSFAPIEKTASLSARSGKWCLSYHSEAADWFARPKNTFE